MVDRNIDRLFTFGCSFTKFVWETWSGILAYELDVSLYNYGQSGAGNLFISNTVSQADSFYKFTNKDLIIVSWTSVVREDRWIDGSWKTPGNLYTQSFWPKKSLKMIDPLGCLIRDIGLIHLTKSFLEKKGCQFYFFSMNDLTEDLSQFGESIGNTSGNVQSCIKERYHDVLQDIQPSFYEVLWQNDLHRKIIQNKNICPNLSDSHPFPLEHCRYLENTLPNIISTDTITKVEEKNDDLIKKINSLGKFDLYKIGNSFYDISCMKRSNPIKLI